MGTLKPKILPNHTSLEYTNVKCLNLQLRKLISSKNSVKKIMITLLTDGMTKLNVVPMGIKSGDIFWLKNHMLELIKKNPEFSKKKTPFLKKKKKKKKKK